MQVYCICSSENLTEHKKNRLCFQGAKYSQFQVVLLSVENIMNCTTHLKLA